MFKTDFECSRYYMDEAYYKAEQGIPLYYMCVLCIYLQNIGVSSLVSVS